MRVVSLHSKIYLLQAHAREHNVLSLPDPKKDLILKILAKKIVLQLRTMCKILTISHLYVVYKIAIEKTGSIT